VAEEGTIIIDELVMKDDTLMVKRSTSILRWPETSPRVSPATAG
jgi:hypothetical protein